MPTKDERLVVKIPRIIEIDSIGRVPILIGLFIVLVRLSIATLLFLMIYSQGAEVFQWVRKAF